MGRKCFCVKIECVYVWILLENEKKTFNNINLLLLEILIELAHAKILFDRRIPEWKKSRNVIRQTCYWNNGKFSFYHTSSPFSFSFIEEFN
jgi:hypothetical protein